MITWWESLTFIEQFYAIVAIPATIILLVQTVMMIMGFGGEHDISTESDVSGIDMDHDFDVSSLDSDLSDMDLTDFDADDFDGTDDISYEHGDTVDVGLRLFTVRGFVAFFTIFGWAGLACMQSGMSIALSLVVAIIGGLISMTLIAVIIRAVTKLAVSGTVDLSNAIGKTATIYIRVPAQRGGRGKVNVLVQERLFEADAVTDETYDLTTGREVTVVGMSGPSTLIVMSKKIYKNT